ncbi:hypothetical protein GRI33_15520 [Brucella sp. BO3]|uniref:hypothetical protein n=1 Tax=unclassified Brucella TaxID=2632610 RepID=UPI00159F0151|nr:MULTISPECIES: hypothetical protein [unclassified Brucella]QMV28328.1 hypothetical protein GRI33_15520 [Brucella sp. BO3]
MKAPLYGIFNERCSRFFEIVKLSPFDLARYKNQVAIVEGYTFWIWAQALEAWPTICRGRKALLRPISRWPTAKKSAPFSPIHAFGITIMR